MSFAILDFEAIKNAVLRNDPYPYMAIDQIIRQEVLDEVLETFPSLSKRGSFPLSTISCAGHFDLLMQDLQKPELRQLIAERFGIDLQEKPPMITVRGFTTERDGNIHVDSKDKLITFLLYLNPNWPSPDGRLRVLYNKNSLTPFAAEISPEAGKCLIFRVTDNCWHGHTVFHGERRSIQLNYVTSVEARNKHLNRHRLSAFLKKLFKKNETPSVR